MFEKIFEKYKNEILHKTLLNNDNEPHVSIESSGEIYIEGLFTLNQLEKIVEQLKEMRKEIHETL